jgi:hypothetical protein
MTAASPSSGPRPPTSYSTTAGQVKELHSRDTRPVAHQLADMRRGSVVGSYGSSHMSCPA